MLVAHDQRLSYRADIDGLRAAAVLAVLGYHAYPNAVAGGFVGVDIFFVISGFLISSIIFQALDDRSFSFANFYARRIRRIFPALILVLFACLVLGWYLLLTDEYIQLGRHALAGAAFGPNFVFLKEAGYFDTAAELKPLLHLWSLGIEEQFYIVWPLFLVSIWRRVPSVLWAIVSIALGSFALNIYLANTRPIQDFYLPITRCWELLAGSILAHLTLYQRAPVNPVIARFLNASPRVESWHDIKSATGVLLIAAAILAINKESKFPGWWALLPTLGTFLIISAGSHAWINRKILAHPALVFLGLISYPLYLWHWPLLSFSHIVTDGDPGTLQKTLILLISFFVSWLTYHFWENPLRKNKSGWNVAFLIALIGLVGFAARMIKVSNGLPSRFPANIQNIVNFPYSYPHRKYYRAGMCFIDAKKQGADAFSEKCQEPANSGLKKVFLWGDSHAAHLYPGLRHYEKEERFGVIQFTAGGCPPVFDVEISKRPYCKTINQKVIEEIKNTSPDLVVMAANWSEDEAAWNFTDLDKLSQTIEALKNFGIKEIILVGPVPVWFGSAPKSLVKFSKLKGWQNPPDRLPSGFATNTRIKDATIEAIANHNAISYISPYRTFCNADGCLAKIDDVPTAIDCCHLTEVGSVFLIKSNLPQILRALQLPTD